MSFAAVFAVSVLDVAPVSNVITRHVELVTMLDAPFAKVLLLNGARWRRDYRPKMKIIGSSQFSVRNIKKMVGRILILEE